MYSLVIVHHKRLGVEKENEMALEWCRKAAHAGRDKTKKIIKRLHKDGKIVL